MRLGFVFLGITVFWLGIFLILVYNISFYLKIQLPVLEARINVERSSARSVVYKDLEKEINELNDVLGQIDRVRVRGSLNVPEILRKFTTALPEGISFTNLTYQGNAISINGHGDTRADALLFKNVLEKNSLCASLNSPVIVKEINIDFSFVCILEQVKEIPQKFSPDSLDTASEEEL